ncbi:MAG TPA: hypothetical protein ENK45_00345 [Aliiroseovarius sp.]|nr:hypothetical protein [Aliiroseovarius sp.]
MSNADQPLTVESYGPGYFRIAGQLHHGPVLLQDREVLGWGGLDDLAPLLTLAGRIDLLVLGMGNDMAHPPAGLARALGQAGIGIEPAATPVALRTHALLLADGRHIALAALPVGAGP